MALIKILTALYTLKVLIYYFAFQKRNSPGIDKNNGNNCGYSFDIIIPMYNEEKTIVKTIDSLSKIQYQNFRITAVDDGSTDNTVAVLKAKYGGNKNFSIIQQSNSGKASALNAGIKQSCAEIIICIDADTLVLPNILDRLTPYFNERRVAAVSGNIKVGNKVNMLTKIQYIEYITNHNYERAIFEQVNGILIIPGAIGAFRKEVFDSLGLYSDDTLTEDAELTLKLLCNNYVIRNAADVVGYTEAPEKIKPFLNQRVRWKVGTFIVLMKYWKPLLKNVSIKARLFVIPYTILFTFILPVLTPIADYWGVCEIIRSKDFTNVLPYILFVTIDAIICMSILLRQKEHQQIIFVFIQRLMLRQLTLIIYTWIIVKGLKGELFLWVKNIRHGSSAITE